VGPSVFIASAAAQPKVGYAYGQVTNLSSDGSSFTLTWTPKAAQGNTAAPKTVQVSVTTATKERTRKGTTGPLAPGDYALVVGTTSPTGLTARRVLYSVSPFKGRAIIARIALHRVAGTVSATTTAGGTTPATLTIVTKTNKTLTFTITATTRFRVNKVLQTTPPAFTAGERVIVRYRRATQTKTLIAIAVVVPAAKTARA
jgi:hypothetical protein